jgi:hypothetical protein
VTFDELLHRIALEPDREYVRSVYVGWPPMETMRGMTVAEMHSMPGLRREPRTFRSGHRLGAPTSAEALDAWQQHHSSHVLPAD